MDELLSTAIRPIAARTLLVSGTATAIAVFAGVPIGYLIARYAFRGRTLILSFINTGMGLPPVVVGLFVWLLLVRSGPFGALDLVYTKTGMIAAQVTTARPIAPETQQTLQTKLRNMTGKSVRIEFATDPDMIGGLVTRIGSTIYDGSVRNQLAQIKEKMAG